MGSNHRISLDDMLKTNGANNGGKISSIDNSKKYNYTKQQMRNICKSLSTQSKDYKPQQTVAIIEKYLKEQDKLERILYSEMSSYHFALNDEEKGTFLTNAECLLLYAIEDSGIEDDIRKIVIKIYDHIQLATRQIENAKNMSKNSVLDAKRSLRDEVKVVEREYITILGIFASIVLAFVGGITFSTSVLQNINNASIFRLILTVDVIGAVLFNTIYLLISFILRINDKPKDDYNKKMRNVNRLLLGIAILVMIGWFFEIKEIQAYFSRVILPWGKK